jgi:hypothetical protein
MFGATAQNSRGVTPWFLDVMGCGNSLYQVPGDGRAGERAHRHAQLDRPLGRLPRHRRRPPTSTPIPRVGPAPHQDVMGIVLSYVWRGSQ